MAEVSIYAEGTAGEVMRVMNELSNELGPHAVIWKDSKLDPQGHDAEHQPYEGFFDVEFQDANRKTDAIHRTIEAVKVVDPESKVITGGDIFKKPV